MLTIRTKLDISQSYLLQQDSNWEDLLFFDIETTGLSSYTSYVYLIGCMFYADHTWQMVQWLADDLASEELILKEFSMKVSSFRKLIHYNGSGFDIPFIMQKCQKYKLENPFQNIESIDLYKKFLPYKKALPLENLKLKTLQAFVNSERNDRYSGEDLIKIYANYIGKLQYEQLYTKRKQLSNVSFTDDNLTDNAPVTDSAPSSEELKEILLLHNKEDIEGLVKVSSLLSYIDIFQYSKIDHMKSLNSSGYFSLDTFHEIQKTEDSRFIKFEVSLPFQVPKAITWKSPLLEIANGQGEQDYIVLSIHPDLLSLQIPIYKGELKFFFDNYKEYYYLPKEDIAIHKSIAQYVDKEFRIQAKAETCYSKQTGSFLPQPEPVYSPCFKMNYHEKFSFLDEHNFLEKDEKVQKYIQSWIHYIITAKETQITGID